MPNDHKLKKSKNDCNAKCEKPCDSSSSETSKPCCNPEQQLDCCTPQYQRLSGLRGWLNRPEVFAVGYLVAELPIPLPTGPLQNTNGVVIPLPNNIAGPTGTNYPDGTYPNGAYYDITNAVSYGPNYTIVNPQYPVNLWPLMNAFSTYFWVNTLRYSTYDPSCQVDQVWGWYVDISTGNLQLYQETDDVPTNVIRLNTMNTNCQPYQKRQTKVLNNLFKLSLKAIKAVGGIPKKEGNIIKISDRCGQEWLLLINLARTYNVNFLAKSSQYVIVACKL